MAEHARKNAEKMALLGGNKDEEEKAADEEAGEGEAPTPQPEDQKS